MWAAAPAHVVPLKAPQVPRLSLSCHTLAELWQRWTFEPGRGRESARFHVLPHREQSDCAKRAPHERIQMGKGREVRRPTCSLRIRFKDIF
eukprot:scaffold3146_cov245-Pinguiococcus_pyrenoidosus.AAC.8